MLLTSLMPSKMIAGARKSAWAVAQANNYMDHPKVMKFSPVDSTMLNLMKSKLTH